MRATTATHIQTRRQQEAAGKNSSQRKSNENQRQTSRKTAATSALIFPENGSVWSTGRRRRPRLQQFLDRNSRLQRSAGGGSSGPRHRRKISQRNSQCRRAGRLTDQAASYFQSSRTAGTAHSGGKHAPS